MKIYKNIGIYICYVLTIISCNNTEIQKESIGIFDMLGRKVEIPKEMNKIICVKPGALRMISYLDAADMVVGVEEVEHRNKNPYNLANIEYENLPIIGPMHGGDAELITMTKPDVIFMTYATINEADKLQNKTGIPVVALQYGDISNNIDIFYSSLKLMAKVINKSQRADSLISYINNLIKDLDRRTICNLKSLVPKIYVGGISYKGMHGISSTDPNFASFKYLNVSNLASEYKSANNNIFVDKEKIIEWNPDKLFIDYAGWEIVKNELKEETFAQTLNAVKNNEVYILLPFNSYTTNFATVFVNAYFIGGVLNADEFSDIKLEEKANEIYNAFLGKSLFKNIIKQFAKPKKVL